MSELLFPVFDVPAIEIDESEGQKYRRSAFFDYETGDFARDKAFKVLESDGKETYMQWCRKMVETERFTCLAYGSDRGTEMYDALSSGDHSAVQSAVERTITEALMVNPKTEYCRGFAFQWNGEDLLVTFTLKGREYDEETITTRVTTI